MCAGLQLLPPTPEEIRDPIIAAEVGLGFEGFRVVGLGGLSVVGFGGSRVLWFGGIRALGI